jgi:hypothetical protein
MRVTAGSRLPATAAVWPRDDLQEMATGVPEINAAPAVVMVDLARLGACGIGPVGQAAIPDAAEDRVELLLADQERIGCVLISSSVSAKSTLTPFAVVTTSKW